MILRFLWNKFQRRVKSGKERKKAEKVVTHKIVPRWSVTVVLNLAAQGSHPGNFEQHQHPVLASVGFGLIGVGWAQHRICLPPGRDHGAEEPADAIYNC